MRARRATVEDLPSLGTLWQLEHLPVDDLEKCFTEFQVATDDGGEILGTAGLRISGNHGLLHAEAIGRAELGDAVREALWQRLQVVARNHSLDRIWTRCDAPFWRAAGFRPANAEEMENVPESFGEKEGWSVLPLRPGDVSADYLEKQFAMMRAMNAQENEKLHRRVAAIKKLALVLTVIVSLLVIAWALVLFRYGPRLMQRGQ